MHENEIDHSSVSQCFCETVDHRDAVVRSKRDDFLEFHGIEYGLTFGEQSLTVHRS